MAKIGDNTVLRSSTWGTDPRAAPDFEGRFGVNGEQLIPGEEVIGVWTYVPPIPMGNRWWPQSCNCRPLCDWYCGFGAYCCYKAKWFEKYPPGLPWLVRPNRCCNRVCCPIASGVGEPMCQGWCCGESKCYCPNWLYEDKPAQRCCCLCPPDGCAMCCWRCVCWPRCCGCHCCTKYSKGHRYELMNYDELSLDKDMRDIEARVPFSMQRLVLTTERAILIEWDEGRDAKSAETLWRKDMDTVRYDVIRHNPRKFALLAGRKKGGTLLKALDCLLNACFLLPELMCRPCCNTVKEKKMKALRPKYRYDFFLDLEFFWKLQSHQMTSPREDLQWRVQLLGDDIETVRLGLNRFVSGKGNYVKPSGMGAPVGIRMQGNGQEMYEWAPAPAPAAPAGRGGGRPYGAPMAGPEAVQVSMPPPAPPQLTQVALPQEGQWK